MSDSIKMNLAGTYAAVDKVWVRLAGTWTAMDLGSGGSGGGSCPGDEPEFDSEYPVVIVPDNELHPFLFTGAGTATQINNDGTSIEAQFLLIGV